MGDNMNKRICLMIKKYCLLELKYDFMGYGFENKKELSYHHLIIPQSLTSPCGFGKGIYEWNGTILTKNTSHAYLHLIELYDYDRYLAITSELLDELFKGYIDNENLYYINDILDSFEKEFQDVKNYKGKCIVKEEYKRRLYKK